MSHTQIHKYERDGVVPNAAFLIAYSQRVGVSMDRIQTLLEADLRGVTQEEWSDLLGNPPSDTTAGESEGVRREVSKSQTRLVELERVIAGYGRLLARIGEHAAAIVADVTAVTKATSRD